MPGENERRAGHVKLLQLLKLLRLQHTSRHVGGRDEEAWMLFMGELAEQQGYLTKSKK
jgi:hypothetical protein